MAEVGLLAPDARVELIEGEVIDMAPIGSRHAGAVNFLMRTFDRQVGDRAIVTVQQPVRLGEQSEPLPDLMLLKPRADFYRDAHPTSADALLVVEVSDAAHGAPEVWIVDVEGKKLHCMRTPVGNAYQSAVLTEALSELAVAALPGIQFDLSGLFDY